MDMSGLSFTQFREQSTTTTMTTRSNATYLPATMREGNVVAGIGGTEPRSSVGKQRRHKQQRLELMQQARQHVNRCTPKERRALIRRLHHTAKALLTPLEKKILKVISLRQKGLEPESYDGQEDWSPDLENRAMSDAPPSSVGQQVRQENEESSVISWSRVSPTATAVQSYAAAAPKPTPKRNKRRMKNKQKQKQRAQRAKLKKQLEQKHQQDSMLFSGLGQCMEQLALWSSENVKSLQSGSTVVATSAEVSKGSMTD